MTKNPNQQLPSEATSTERVDCPACNSTNISDSISGIGPVCKECGAVVSVPIEIEYPDAEFEQNSNQTKEWSEYYSVTNSTEQLVADAFEVLEEIAVQLAIPSSVRERAAEIYTDAALCGLTDGRPTELLVAACVTTAGRESRSPFPAERISSLVDEDVHSVRRICRELQRELEIDISPCVPEDYLANLIRLLELNKSTKTSANQILSAIPSQNIGGKDPCAIAGAAIYLAAEGAVTQREVAASTAVTTETIRVRVNECRESINGGNSE